MNMPLHRIVAAVSLALAASQGFAADPLPASPPAPAKAAPRAKSLAQARALIAEGQWAAAVSELERVNDSGSADWNNLMGYSLRKGKAANWAASEKYYDAALRIDPRHRGALEYSGELYLSMNDLPKAEQRLAALAQACGTSCTEYADLKSSIDSFKANGGRKN